MQNAGGSQRSPTDGRSSRPRTGARRLAANFAHPFLREWTKRREINNATPISSSAISKVMLRPSNGQLTGDDLLNDLRGSNGVAMRSVAIGYLMGLLEATPQLGDEAGPAREGSSSLSLEQAVKHVETGLKRTQPTAADQPPWSYARHLVRSNRNAPRQSGLAGRRSVSRPSR